MNRPIYRNGDVLGICTRCGRLNYVESHGATAQCACQPDHWLLHNSIPYKYRDASGCFITQLPPTIRSSITLSCPTCNTPFYCYVEPPDFSMGIMGATIVDVFEAASNKPVCSHVETWFNDFVCLERRNPESEKFADSVYDQLDRQDETR